MARNKRGKCSFSFSSRPVISAWASVAGKKEAQGPLAGSFDKTFNDTLLGQKTWEQAEKKMQELCLKTLAEKAGVHMWEIDLVYSGDLLNQCIGSSFSLRNMNIPHLGLYGACSTMAESLLLAGLTVDGGYADRVAAMTSSHFASSERQYRFPLGYGGQRTPTAQWTVTGSGSALVCGAGKGPRLTCATVGTVRDLGVKDAGNMGAAMAPAAYSTIRAHLEDMKLTPKDYDLIVTGDLGKLGMEIVIDLFAADGIELRGNYNDCGIMLFDLEGQDVHCGASGCGCAASVLTGYLLNGMREGKWHNLLFCATGALHSPTSLGQGESIPGICHAVAISTGK